MDIYHILQLTTEEGERHDHYDRTVDLADEYFRYVTGIGIDELLHQFVRRESKAEFNQRVTITQQVTPAWSNKINKAFKKTHRSDGINKVIKLDKENDSDLERVVFLSNNYKGKKSVEKYLMSAFDRYNMIDPNAYLVNSFEVNETPSEPNQPLAIEYISQNVLNYEYKNDILQWIVLRDFIKVQTGKNEVKELERFQLLFIGGTVVMTPISKEEFDLISVAPDKKITEETKVFILGGIHYKIETIENDLKVIPAKPFGFKEDLATNGETFVSLWHEALPYFAKSLKVVSESDLTAALSAFPQKRQYVGACNYDDCHKGWVDGGNSECPECKGSGLAPISTSAQDAITYRLPADMNEIVDIDKLVTYDNPDTDILKWQDDKIDSLEADAMGAIFNSDTLVKTTVVNTATEQNNKKDNINDPLLGYAEGFSEIYKFIIRTNADNTGIDSDNVIVAYEFPKDFKFETIQELITIFDSAVQAGASPNIKGAISKKIAAKVFIDDPIAKMEFDVEQELRPFANELEEKVEKKIALNLVNKSTAFLWANFNDIICIVKLEDPKFFLLPRDTQKETLKQKAIELDETNATFTTEG